MLSTLRRSQSFGPSGNQPCSYASRVRSYSVFGRLWLLRILLLLLGAVVSLTATAAVGQDVNYSSVEATADKPVQLSYHASAHKNCTPAALPTIRVIEAPRSGTLTVRSAVLTTDKVTGCPGLKTSAQVLFYLAHTGYAGPDRVKYEVTSENGEVTTYEGRPL
jgi:hypothetical protein